LINIGNGITLRVVVPLHMHVPFDKPMEMVHRTFPELINGVVAADACILTSLNKHVDQLNDLISEVLEGSATTYLSADYFGPEAVEEEGMYPVEVLNILNPCGMPSHKLVLKEGAPVVFIRNMSRKEGIMNGTRAIVTKCCLHRVQVRLASGPKAGLEVAVPRINLQSPDNGLLHINFTRRQFPLRLAFCMTINKSQGQTFKRVGVWLPSPVFSHGQLYVALSRVGDPLGLCIGAQPTTAMDPLVQGVANIVWKELLD
jgi:ATP-dependent DNA helicase PIF1